MGRFVVALLTAVLLAWPPTTGARADGSDCRFVLGFATLHALIPDIVGICLDDEQHNPANGDGLQHTTHGLLVWRKADNFTAFTDGYRTWVNGPYGLEERLNSERFPWEADAGGPYPLVEPAAAAQLRRYYDAINRRDYAAAYALLEAPAQSFEQFAAGYRDTAHVDLALGRPEANNAAGHLGLDIPTVLLARQTDGTLRGYAGCYTLVTLNPHLVPPGMLPPPWKIATAEIHPLPGLVSLSDPAAAAALDGPCPGHQSAA